MQKMIWTPRESDLPPLVQSTMHLPKYPCARNFPLVEALGQKNHPL
jgi:hypothetical protein